MYLFTGFVPPPGVYVILADMTSSSQPIIIYLFIYDEIVQEYTEKYKEKKIKNKKNKNKNKLT